MRVKTLVTTVGGVLATALLAANLALNAGWTWLPTRIWQLNRSD